MKVSNVLISNDVACCKLADLGSSAHLAHRNAKVNVKMGTKGYYAPEILNKKPFGIEADVYSLGALLYALLTL